MTEGYGSGDRDETGGGERLSGRGAVAERRAGQDEELREIDLTDEAADREQAAVADRGASGSLKPPPAAAAPAPAGTSIFDVGRDEAAEPGEPEPAAEATTAEATTAEAAAAAPATPAAAALDADGVRNRFLDIQAGFVDEPRQAVEEAGRFVEELAQQVIDALQAQRGQLQLPVADASTEDLRLAMRSYRQFVDRLLGLGL
jgi:hypothetical protein